MIALYYYENLTLREIGEVLGVTESRVSQLHTKAVLRLRSRMQEESFDDLACGGLAFEPRRTLPATAAGSLARTALCVRRTAEARRYACAQRRTGFATWPWSAIAGPARHRCTRRCCSRRA